MCEKCENVKKVIGGRLKTIRPIDKYWHETNLLWVIAKYLEDEDLIKKIQELRDEIIESGRRKSIRKLEIAGYKVEKQ